MMDETQTLVPEEESEKTASAPEEAETEVVIEADSDEAGAEYEAFSREELIAELVQKNEINQGLIAQMDELRGRATAAENEVQRMAADFQNARRRLDRSTEERIDEATRRFATQLLPVVDDLELALANLPETVVDEDAAWVKGVSQIHGKILKTLASQRIEPMAKEGPFDPELHEAVQQMESADHESGHIIETMRTGFTFKDKVLRPSMVRIAA